MNQSNHHPALAVEIRCVKCRWIQDRRIRLCHSPRGTTAGPTATLIKGEMKQNPLGTRDS